MQTNSPEAAQKKIEELEEWLKSNPADHPSRPQVETDLRNSTNTIDKIKDQATF
jgi:hypothetical protein